MIPNAKITYSLDESIAYLHRSSCAVILITVQPSEYFSDEGSAVFHKCPKAIKQTKCNCESCLKLGGDTYLIPLANITKTSKNILDENLIKEARLTLLNEQFVILYDFNTYRSNIYTHDRLTDNTDNYITTQQNMRVWRYLKAECQFCGVSYNSYKN